MNGKEILKFDLELLNNAGIFEKINSQTELCVRLFTEIANLFPQEKLLLVHPGSKGVKISKGNQLKNKPYQVLDLVRDFDPVTGFNIRVLNWWGVGMYCFVLYGSKTAIENENQINNLLKTFAICEVDDKWDYDKVVHISKPGNPDLKKHLSHYDHCQLVMPIALDEDFETIKSRILASIQYILNHHIR